MEQAQNPHCVATAKGNRKSTFHQSKVPSQSCSPPCCSSCSSPDALELLSATVGGLVRLHRRRSPSKREQGQQPQGNAGQAKHCPEGQLAGPEQEEAWEQVAAFPALPNIQCMVGVAAFPALPNIQCMYLLTKCAGCSCLPQLLH